MSEMDVLFPLPDGRRNADDMGMPPEQAMSDDERHRDELLAENERLRALLRRVLSCGLNEEPHGAGFTPSRQERLAGELAADISAALAAREKT